MMVFISKVNNYMFRPKAAIFSYHDYNFVQRVSYIYIYVCVCVCVSILHTDVEISSSFYVLQVSLSSGMSSESMNGGLWISLVGYVLGSWGVVYGGL